MYSISRIGQLMKGLPRGAFEQAVQRHAGDRHSKGFGSWDQLVAMIYAQLSGATSLRQVEAGFNQHLNHHYHLATGPVRRSTLADANAKRNPEVFADTVRALMQQAGRSLRAEREQMLYLLDSTSVTVKGDASGKHQGMKLHLLYESQGAAPLHQSITPANVNDIEEAKKLAIEPHATYVFDKGYTDYSWWSRIDGCNARFVTRFKYNAALKIHRHLPIARGEEGTILQDSIVSFALRRPRGGHCNNYTKRLRRIEVAREGERPLVLATNDLRSRPSEIAQLYKERWQIELFFKWLKQHLSIKRFLGTSANAVRIQLLTALIAYLLLLLYRAAQPAGSSLWQLLGQLRAGLFQRPVAELSRWQRRRQQHAFIQSVQPNLFL